MRVEICDSSGYCHVITSENPATLGLWFAEMTQKLVSVNSTAWTNTLTVSPTTREETIAIGQPPVIPMSQTLLADLGLVLNEAV